MAESLEQVTPGYEALAPEVRELWGEEQVQTIRNTVARDLSLPEFQMGMAVAARYGLDPLLHEIWFVKGRSEDGGAGRTMIMAGRDGFLKVARRQPDYRGLDCDVVRAKDEFKVERLPTGERLVHHSYEGTDVDRGPIAGAWAIAIFEGKVPFYYYAPLAEYRPRNERKLRFSPWGTQESVMILKCCQSYVLRIACGISGVIGAEEVDRALEGQEGTSEETSLAAVMANVPYDLRDRLHAAYGEAAHLRPGQLTVAGLQMSIKNQDRSRVEEYLVEVEARNAEARERAEEVRDAEVVEGDERISATDHSGDEVERLAQTMGEDLGGGSTSASAAPARAEAKPDNSTKVGPSPAAQENVERS